MTKRRSLKSTQHLLTDDLRRRVSLHSKCELAEENNSCTVDNYNDDDDDVDDAVQIVFDVVATGIFIFDSWQNIYSLQHIVLEYLLLNSGKWGLESLEEPETFHKLRCINI